MDSNNNTSNQNNDINNIENNSVQPSNIYTILLLSLGFIIIFGLITIILYLSSKRNEINNNESVVTRLCESIAETFSGINNNVTQNNSINTDNIKPNIESLQNIINDLFKK